MKTFRLLSALLIGSLFLVSACKKDEVGPVGQKTITGTITYKNGDGTTHAAMNAEVKVAYGTTTATTTFNQTCMADEMGMYTIKGLAAGDYYFAAEYTDGHGFKYETPGYSVTIKDDKAALTVDMVLQ